MIKSTEKPDARKEVFAACKRGNDPMTSGQKCDSNRAYQINQSGSSSVSLQCAKCGHNWVIGIGGSFNL